MMLQGTTYTQISSTGGKNTHHGESRTLFYAQCFTITCFLSYLLFTYHHYLSNFSCWTSDGAVLVTGATGRTGSFLYHELKRRGVSDLRAFVRNVDKAREVLGCIACDETEGIYVGDVTQPQDLKRAMAGVKTLAIAVGAGARSSPDVQRQVEFNSVVYSIEALANGGGSRPLSVVLCSSMGTNITPQPSWAGDVLFWKLNAEAFLSSSAIGRTIIVKPCGLKEGMAGKNSTLLVGHNGTITDNSDYHTVSREDVASVMAEAVLMPYDSSRSTNLRFDLCSEPGPATKDLQNLIENARYEWNK